MQRMKNLTNSNMNRRLEDVFRNGNFDRTGNIRIPKKRKYDSTSANDYASNKKIKKNQSPLANVLNLANNVDYGGGNVDSLRTIGNVDVDVDYQKKFSNSKDKIPYSFDSKTGDRADEDDDDDVMFDRGNEESFRRDEVDPGSKPPSEELQPPVPDFDPNAKQPAEASACKKVTELEWMPYLVGKFDRRDSMEEHETKEERKMNRKKNKNKMPARFGNSTDGNIDEESESERDSVVPFRSTSASSSSTSSSEEEEEVRRLKLSNFGNLGQRKVIDGRTVMDDIKRALINCNHGLDELVYCKMIADKFNECVAKPFNESRNSNIRSVALGKCKENTERKAGQQKIESYLVKHAVKYWTTEEVYEYRKRDSCPIGAYMDIAKGFKEMHDALRGSVVFQHRNEVYPDGRPVIKVEERILKAAMDCANMYYKFTTAKPHESVYSNATRKILTGINDLSDIVESSSNENKQQNSRKGNSNSGRGARGVSVNGGKNASANSNAKKLHPAVIRNKERTSMGAVAKVGGYVNNAQVNQFAY